MIINLNIPDNVKLFVKKGQKVDFDTPLLEKAAESKVEINLSQKLKVRSEKIFDYLKKFIGDWVKKDEVIAEKKGLFFDKKILSPLDGEIKEINHDLGVVIISSLTDKKIVNSFFRGEIVDIEKSILKIKIKNGISYSIKQTKIDYGGEVYYYQNQPSYVADAIENKIVVFETIDPFNQIKIEALGALAFVSSKPIQETTEIPYFQLKNQKDIQEIFSLKKSACTVLKDECKIIFYD